MIRRAGENPVTVMEPMFGGDGKVTLEHFWTKDEMDANNRLCAKLIVEPGCSSGFHVHNDEEEIFIILKGQGEVDDNGEKSIVNVGDTILTKGGSGHAIRCVGDETLELLAIISLY